MRFRESNVKYKMVGERYSTGAGWRPDTIVTAFRELSSEPSLPVSTRAQRESTRCGYAR